MEAATDTPSLTVWEAKERAGLLALETAEWRDKRLIAEDPNTTADVLDQIASYIDFTDYDPYQEEEGRFDLLTDALLAHPNTPVDIFIRLLELLARPSRRVFCGNPVTPFLSLEQPDIWEELDPISCQELLREESLPPSVVFAFCQHKDEAIAQVAHLHIVVAGAIQSQTEGNEALRTSAFASFAAGHYLT